AWTWSWLNEAYRLLGVRPMIYTRASFWQQYMNDTQEFAKGSYKLLWIASWAPGGPVLPANKWGGHGWTFWQWTDCGSVPGIAGCVDLDRYQSTDLTQVTIPILRVGRTGPGTVSSLPVGIDCGTTCAALFDPGSSVALSASPDP